jgi:hypothetical protein
MILVLIHHSNGSEIIDLSSLVYMSCVMLYFFTLYSNVTIEHHVTLFVFIIHFSELETVQLTENNVNPNGERISPHDFQLLKVLGKGGYGKVN